MSDETQPYLIKCCRGSKLNQPLILRGRSVLLHIALACYTPERLSHFTDMSESSQWHRSHHLTRSRSV